MKKYPQTVNIFSKKKITYLLFSFFILCIAVFFVRGFYSYIFIICSVICSGLFLLWLTNQMFLGRKYCFLADSVQTYFCGLKVKKIYYKDINTVVFSNAVHTVKNGSLSAFIPLYDNIIIEGKKQRVQCAYMSWLPSDKICKHLKPQMNSLQILWDDSEQLYGAVCQYESLTELFDHHLPYIYILEDVYYRFNDMFDSIICFYYKENRDYAFIITNAGSRISYFDYKLIRGQSDD